MNNAKSHKKGFAPVLSFNVQQDARAAGENFKYRPRHPQDPAPRDPICHRTARDQVNDFKMPSTQKKGSNHDANRQALFDFGPMHVLAHVMLENSGIGCRSKPFASGKPRT